MNTIAIKKKKSLNISWGYTLSMFMMILVMILCTVRMLKMQDTIDTLEKKISLYEIDDTGAYRNGRYDYAYNARQVRYEQYFSNVYQDDTAITVFKDDFYTDVDFKTRVEASEELIKELKRFYNYYGNIDLEVTESMGDVEGIIDDAFDFDMTTYYNYGYYVISENSDNCKIYINKQVVESENPFVLVYAITHEFLGLYYHQLISSLDESLYDMRASELQLKDNYKLNLMAEELNAYRGEPKDLENWLRSNSPFSYTERIIMDDSLNFINNNRKLLLDDK